MMLVSALGWLSGLAFVAPDLPPTTLAGTALALNVCDAIFCRLLAANNGYSRNAWTVAGLIAGVWAAGVLILLPRRAATAAPSRPLR